MNGLSFIASPGEQVAIVGPGASGKSTLMSLIQRFYDPDEGEICIDSRPLKRIKQASIRANIGIALQDSRLFNETVFENILYGRLTVH